MTTAPRRDSGATLVEAAFAVPMFFFLVFGLIDFGLFGFEDNRAGNAARDGARIGIINFVDTTDPSNPVGADENKTNLAFRAIKAAIDEKLPGVDLADGDVTVVCLEPDDDPTPCADARVDIDRISVSVEWDYEFLSPVAAVLGFDTRAVDGEARMVLVGTPSGGTAPSSPCAVSGISVTPSVVALADTSPSELASDLVVAVSATGSCNLTVSLDPPGAEPAFEICTGTCASTTYDGTLHSFWETGVAEASVTGGNVNRFASFTVEEPVGCTVSAFQVTPDPVQRWTSGPSANQLTSNLSIPVSATGDCDGLTVTVAAPSGGSRVICGPSASCASALTYGAATDSFWTSAGTGTVTVDGGENTPVTDTFTVANSPSCTVTGFTTNPSPVKRDAQNKLPQQGGYRLRITLSATGPCSNLAVSVDPPGAAGAITFARVGSWVYEYNASSADWPTGTATVSVTGDAAYASSFPVSDP